MLGESLQAGHCYICLLCEKSREIEKIYEWCGPGVDPKLCPLLGGSVDSLPWQSNPQPASKKNFLFSSEIRQGRSESEQGPEEKEKPPILLVPIFYRKSSIAIMGVDGVGEGKPWPEETIVRLRTTGEVLVNSWKRKRVEEELWETRERYRSLVENMNDVIFSLLPLPNPSPLTSVTASDSLISFPLPWRHFNLAIKGDIFILLTHADFEPHREPIFNKVYPMVTYYQ